MITWESNFNIPESTVQLAVAFVRVESHRIRNGETLVRVLITGETEEILARDYEITLEGEFTDLRSIYEQLMLTFTPSTLNLE